jgi:DNA invertase Pin-like site-specific DNA recombinase
MIIGTEYERLTVMRVAIYARVSLPKRLREQTDEELRKRQQEVKNQLLQLRKFCWEQKWEIVEEFVDHKTGKDSERPGFQEMFQAAERKQFDLLLFWALDRVSREGVLATLKHFERLRLLGIKFRSFTEPYLDTLGPFGDVIIALLAALAQQERNRISERTKAGMQRAAAAGKKFGRTDGRNIDPQQAAMLYASNLSVSQVAQRLQISKTWAHKLIRKGNKIVENPVSGNHDTPIATTSVS